MVYSLYTPHTLVYHARHVYRICVQTHQPCLLRKYCGYLSIFFNLSYRALVQAIQAWLLCMTMPGWLAGRLQLIHLIAVESIYLTLYIFLFNQQTLITRIQEYFLCKINTWRPEGAGVHIQYREDVMGNPIRLSGARAPARENKF